MGIGVIMSCMKAQGSAQFEKMSTMMAAESNDTLDLQKATQAMLIVGIVSILGSTCGIFGAFKEYRGPVCLFAIFAGLLGLVFLGMMAAMLAFLESTYHDIVKETNRICRDPVATAHVFQCKLPAVNAATGIPQVTAPPAIHGEHIGTVPVETDPINQAPSTRRLAMVLFAQSLSRSWSYQNFGGQSFLSMAGNGSSVGLHQGRRLDAGTTEDHFLTSVCGRLKASDSMVGGCNDECQLIAALCVQPQDFDELTACVCDAKGPRRFHMTGVIGEAPQPSNGFVNAQCPPSMIVDGKCQGTGCSIPPSMQTEGLEQEGCWVLPSTKCQGVASEPYPGGNVAENPYWSPGPCSKPDERSKVVLEGFNLCLWFIGFTGALGAVLLLSSCCSCCLVCELHTDKRPDQHARQVLFGQEMSEASDLDSE